MDICLLSQSSQVKDFIYLIKKILKKGTGISQVSQRLYKPVKAKSDYQKPQLKRPSNVFPKKVKQTQSVKVKVIQEESFEEPKILESIVTTWSDQLEETSNEVKSIKQIPKTFLQTMAYNLKEQGLINKLKHTLQDQIKYLQDRLNFYNNMQSKKQVIQISWQELESKDRTDRLKAWSYFRAEQQMEQMTKEIDLFLIPLGYKIEEKTYNTKLEQMEKIIQKQSGTLELCLSNLNGCKQLNFFDNENVTCITEFLISFQEAYDCSENTRQVLLNENSYCDALQTLKMDALKIFNQIKEKHNTFFIKYQQQDGQQKIFHALLDIKLLDMVKYFIIQKAEYIPKHYQDILGYMDRILELEKALAQFKEKLPHVLKFLKLRDKQLKTLEIVINFINSSYPYNKSLLVETFYYKEVKFLELNLTTFDYLLYFSQQVNDLQTQLLVKNKFISSINLRILNAEFLNQKEEIAEVKEKVVKNEKLIERKMNPSERNQEYIRKVEQKFKKDQEFVQKRLVKEDDRLKGEKENKIEILKAKLLRSNISAMHNEKRNQFLEKKSILNQQVTTVKQVVVAERKHLDILGQIMYLIQDARFKLFSNESKQYSNQIVDFYHQHMYKQGFPKKFQLSKMQHLQETITLLSNNYQAILNQYLSDKQYKQYIEITKKTEFVEEAQNLDFFNYSLAVTLKLLYIIDYHDKFFTVQYFLKYRMPQLPDYDFESLQQFLLGSQRNAENLYDYLQKNSDTLLRIDWHSTNKIKCSESKQEKLYQIMRKVNHCTIARFEVIRHIMHQLSIQIFHEFNQEFDIRKIAVQYIQQILQEQLQSKIKYFPKLSQQIFNQIEPFLIYLEQSILCNLDVYYMISLLSEENVELDKIKKVLNLLNLGQIDSVELFQIKAVEYILSRTQYCNRNFDTMIKNIIDSLPRNKLSLCQKLQDFQQTNLTLPNRVPELLTIDLELDVDTNLILEGDNFKKQKTYSISNLQIESRFLIVTTSQIPKHIKLSVNNTTREVSKIENILNLPSFSITIDRNEELIIYLYK